MQCSHMGAVQHHTWGQKFSSRCVIAPDRLVPTVYSVRIIYAPIYPLGHKKTMFVRVCLLQYHKFDVSSRAPAPALCGCCVWTFGVLLTDTGPVCHGHYLWPCSGYCQWPRKEMKNLYAGGGIKSRGTKMSVLINLHCGSKSMTKSCFVVQSLAPGCIQYGASGWKRRCQKVRNTPDNPTPISTWSVKREENTVKKVKLYPVCAWMWCVCVCVWSL